MKLDTSAIRTLALSTFVSMAAGCTTLSDTKPAAFNPGAVNAMVFHLSDSSKQLRDSLDSAEIVRRVNTNLGEWGYPFASPESADYSHELSMEIGTIRHGSTPVGFSFSAGNSDPRALDFQKAEVLPLTCALTPKGQPEVRAELTMEVMADDYSRSVEHSKLTDSLVNDISTACFNLLSSLNVKTVQPTGSDKTLAPSWIPEIRVETEPETANEASKTSSPLQSNKPASSPPRKRIIIHNQGNPVIFKFGHERK